MGHHLLIRVQGIKLLPQDQTNACWFASTMMMYRLYKNRGGKAPDPSLNTQIQAVHRANNGLAWAVMKRYAEIVGMRPKPLLTPTVEQLGKWLSTGPLWTDGMPVDWKGNIAGRGHVVVLAGLREVPNSDKYEVYVFDPWPVGKGHEGWRPISHLVSIMTAGANLKRNVTFLSY